MSLTALTLRFGGKRPTPPPLNLSVTDNPITTAIINSPYGGFSIHIEGGQPPYVVTMPGGTVPGIALSGSGPTRLWSGEPTTLGTYTNIYFRVADAGGSTPVNTTPFSIEVTEGEIGEVQAFDTSFTFDAPVVVREYVVPGSPGVVGSGPLNLISTSPTYALTSGTVKQGSATKVYTNREENGLMINPGSVANYSIPGINLDPLLDPQGQLIGHGYDSLSSNPTGGPTLGLLYRGELNFDPGKRGTVTGLINKTLVKAISIHYPDPTPRQDREQLKQLAMVTLPEALFPVGSFRPAPSWADKSPPAHKDDLDRSFFPNLAPPAGVTLPDYAAMLARLQRPWDYSLLFNTGGQRTVIASDNQPNYGQDIGWIVNRMMLLMCLNTLTTSQKHVAQEALAQQAIDLFFRIKPPNYGYVRGLGGGDSYRLAILAFGARSFAGTSLGDEMAAYLNYEENYDRWGEYSQIFEPGARYTRIKTEPFDAESRPLNQYTHAMVGVPDWRQTEAPTGAGWNFDATYRSVVASYEFGGVLAMRLMGILPLLSATPLERYMDRYADMFKARPAGSNNVPAFDLAMYNLYRGAQTDGNAPTRSALKANGAEVWIETDDYISEASIPAASAFALTVNGSPRTIGALSLEQQNIFGPRVRLLPTTPINPGDTVTLAYTAGASPLRNYDGAALANFSAQAVTNLTGVGPPAFTSADLTYKTGATRSRMEWPIAQNVGDVGQTSWMVIGIAARQTGPLAAPSRIVSTTDTNRFYIGNATATTLQIAVASNSLARARPTKANLDPSLGTEFVWFLAFDLSKATKEAGGVQSVINGVVQDVSTSEYTFNSNGGLTRFSLIQVFNTALGIGAGPDGEAPANVGLRFLYLDHGVDPSTKPDLTDPDVIAAMTVATIGGNGQNISGRVPFGFWPFTVADANSPGGVINRGHQIDLAIEPAAGTWTA